MEAQTQHSINLEDDTRIITISMRNFYNHSYSSSGVLTRDVEAVEYFCFRFQLHVKLVASELASASSFFLQSAFASSKI